MRPIKEAATDFLAHRRIAVTGVSRTAGGHGSNVVYQRLRERGYDVFAVNPNATDVEGDRCFPDLRSIPGGVEALDRRDAPRARGGDHARMRRARHPARLDAPPIQAPAASRPPRQTSAAAGHRSPRRRLPVHVGPTADRGHKVMRGVLTLTRNVPRRV